MTDSPSPSNNSAYRPSVDIAKARVGATYARALLGVAQGSERPEELVRELDELVTQVLRKFSDFQQILASPRITAEQRRGIIERVLGGRVSDPMMRFLLVVSEHGRMDCLEEIRQVALEEFEASRGGVTVQVITAAPLNDEQRRRIREVLSQKVGRRVELQDRCDPDILGGLVVRVGDTVFDGSVANQLRRLRADAVERTLERLRQSADQLAGELSA